MYTNVKKVLVKTAACFREGISLNKALLTKVLL